MSEAAKVYKNLIWQDPERVSGAPCFYGTRVPIKHLFEYIANGYTLKRFAEIYELPLETVKGVLREAREGLKREIESVA